MILFRTATTTNMAILITFTYDVGNYFESHFLKIILNLKAMKTLSEIKLNPKFTSSSSRKLILDNALARCEICHKLFKVTSCVELTMLTLFGTQF